MGVKFAREYSDIIHDLAAAIGQIERIYSFFEMTEGEWNELEEEERLECIRTVADDVFYGLGAESELSIGDTVITHDKDNHILKLSGTSNVVSIVKLT